MALGGALRAAIKAADWVNVARESRRRARALADLNARGGIRGTGAARGATTPAAYLRSQGLNPYDYVPPGGILESPFGGRRIVASASGLPAGRSSAPSFVGPSTTMSPMRSPIEAPYEGFRVLPPNSRIGVSEDLRVPPGQWQGRGAGTSWAEMPFNGYDAIDGTYYSPIREPAFPDWRFSAFGDVGFAPNIPRFSSPGMTPVPFEEVMRAQGSLMGDPRFGPYVPF